ncbi:nephronectin [Austrofundulus limnaeus]|uniref:Nephronectin n=1 Tax=Austrofundulus limnaeus TaxID=52670 RepID=A0A2I4B6A8_AUSLI|nr:PREDICTED: nephronectin-like [Austrofundulus limnaeus]
MTEARQVFMVMVHFILLSLAHQRRSVEGRQDKLGHTKTGLSKFNRTISCSFKWRNVDGICQPACRKSCGNGKCVRRDKCSCFPGYEGSQCDEDVNECGLLERLCSQRCVNTPGSYRCYCEPGYTLSADGYTCVRETTCFALRCQFGCQLEKVGVGQCLCPPGLHLAVDNRTCEDVNECQDPDVCPHQRTCRNTFGSFLCVCRDGFVMGTVHGSVECRDKDECLIGSHQCSRHARCINTVGSYTCHCSDDYFGNGRTCRLKRTPQSKAVMYFNYKLSKRMKPIDPYGTIMPQKRRTGNNEHQFKRLSKDKCS